MGAKNPIPGKEIIRVEVQGQTKNLLILRDAGSTKLFHAHPLVDAFNKEHGTGLTVVSHKAADIALTVNISCDNREGFPDFAVDASIAYEKAGKRLGKEIVFSAEGEPRVVMATGKYKGERDAALVALGLKSADFIKDGKSIALAISDDRLIAVPNFPRRKGWYMPHEQTGVPQDIRVTFSCNPEARCLTGVGWAYEGSYVGLLGRDVYGHNCSYGWRYIDATWEPSSRPGVVVEVPHADLQKIEPLLDKPPEAPKRSYFDPRMLD